MIVLHTHAGAPSAVAPSPSPTSHHQEASLLCPPRAGPSNGGPWSQAGEYASLSSLAVYHVAGVLVWSEFVMELTLVTGRTTVNNFHR